LTREQLEHAIRAACDVSGDTEIWIFGFQAILGEFPNAPESLRTSIEVDVQPKNNPDKIDEIDGSLGELSIVSRNPQFLCTWNILRDCKTSEELGEKGNRG